MLAWWVRLRQQPRVWLNYLSMDDSRNQQLRVYTNALDFATAVDDGIDSHFSFDNDPDAEIGARAKMAVSLSSKVC